MGFWNRLFGGGWPRIVAYVEDKDRDGRWRFRFVEIAARGASPDTVSVSSIEDGYASPESAERMIRRLGFRGEIVRRLHEGSG